MGFVKLNNGPVRALSSKALTSQIREVTALDPQTLEYLERDLARIPLELFNLMNGSRRTRLYVCEAGGRITGYLFVSTFPEAFFVNTSGEDEAVADLLTVVPRERAVIIAPAPLLNLVTARVPATSVVPMILMVLRRGEENLVADNPAIRLTPQFASEYAALVHSSAPLSRVEESLLENGVYGVLVDGRLVSVASAEGRLPKAAFIMGVMTSPEYRGRGYGALATSAAVRDALASSELASLGVRTDNLPAIRMYERLGFRRVGEEVWVDLGTGLRP